MNHSVPYKILSYSVLFSDFGFLDFTFLEGSRQLCFNPLAQKARSIYLCPPVIGWPSIPEHYS
jgi:hypothetical protein